MNAALNFGGYFDVDRLQDEKAALEEQASKADFWNNPDQAREVNSRIESLNQVVGTYSRSLQTLADLKELLPLSDSKDPMLAEADDEILKVEAQLRQLELRQMLSEAEDKLPAIVSVNAGSGGTEAQDWAQIIQRMLMRYAQHRNFSVELVDEQFGDGAGIKSCTFIARGEFAYGYFKSERGVHRLVRISPFDANKRRHTSFAAVDVVPEVDDSIEIEIRPEDLKVDTFRAGGAGGQHVNRTDSAVRITHIPSGVVVACQTQRSQHQNRATAMTMLRSKLYEIEMQKRQANIDAKNAEKKDISWGSQIRSYVLHPYRMIKDHRTGHETGNIDPVLDGDLEAFVEAYLLERKEK